MRLLRRDFFWCENFWKAKDWGLGTLGENMGKDGWLVLVTSVSKYVCFHPYLGKISNLAIFFRWVESTNQVWLVGCS